MLLAFLIYGRGLGYAYLDWDDVPYILNNPQVRKHLLVRGWRDLLLTPHLGYPQPLVVLWQRFAFQAAHTETWLLHLGNLLMHALNGALVFGILRTYGLSLWPARLGAALFLCHPIAVEPVEWMTGAKDVFAGTAVLGGFLLFRHARATLADNQKRATLLLCGVVLCQVLGFGCKPIAVALPGLLCLDLLLQPTAGSRRPAFTTALCGLLSAGLVLVSLRSQTQVGAIQGKTPLLGRLLHFCEHWALQLRNYVVPSRLLPNYADLIEPKPLTSLVGITGVLALLLTLGALVALWRRERRGALGLLWALCCFTPSSGLIPLNRGPADSYLYLASVGFCLLAALLAEAAIQRGREPALLRLGGLLVVVLSAASIQQVGVWEDPVSLWKAAYDLDPVPLANYRRYANGLIITGRIREGIAVYEEAMARGPYPPADPDVLVAMGDGCLMARELRCAARWWGEALRHFPPDPRRALRLAALWRMNGAELAADQAPKTGAGGYAAEARAAETVTRGALTPLRGDAAAQGAFFQKYLAEDRNLRPALGAYLQDTDLGPVARDLLARYPKNPPRR